MLHVFEAKLPLLSIISRRRLVTTLNRREPRSRILSERRRSVRASSALATSRYGHLPICAMFILLNSLAIGRMTPRSGLQSALPSARSRHSTYLNRAADGPATNNKSRFNHPPATERAIILNYSDNPLLLHTFNASQKIEL